eukprot:TRINITY_DN14643_c0_g1_i5.p1 TRINITY_DN14643_c0_g1~~TRINITY_DN14643_c0_g1_i5.p1  ORF type:complete len:660 (+),score=149.68 TRINITY_DN14643_c0_g1_i5:254-2233(+)
MSFSWQRTGGLQNRPPPTWPSPPTATHTRQGRWSYYQNVVTESYSMWWWGWGRWEAELDWCLVHGINLALAYVGQEQLYREVYNSLGVNDSVVIGSFDGPAFLAWSRGQGSAGVGGPLPEAWLTDQVSLNKNITARMRALGISPVLPAFQGNVPAAFRDIFPGHNISSGPGAAAWLDSQDPLFAEIASRLRAKVIEAFGESVHYEADGWFGLQTGPWYSEAPCLGGFVIPSEDEGRERAATVFSLLSGGQQDAVWVFQGYPFSRVSAGSDCNKTALVEYVRGFVDGVPKDDKGVPRLLVLDLIADYDNPAWQLWSNENGTLLHGAPSVWCALNNWGGTVHTGGDVRYAVEQAGMALRAGSVGVGLTPEGIDNDPAYFEAVLDAPWGAVPQAAEDRIVSWGVRRCGRDVAEVREAYSLLYRTLYAPGQPYLFCCQKPVFCPTALPGKDRPARPRYDTAALRRALTLMVGASQKCGTKAFGFDVADVAREWLSMGACLERWDRVANASKEQLSAAVEDLLNVSADVDRMMSTTEGFLLGLWLKGARELGGRNVTMADFYEWNARSQITTWQPIPDASGTGGIPGIADYARKEWSGVVKEYYSGRVRVWLNYTLGVDQTPLQTSLAQFAYRWQHTRWDPEQLPAEPTAAPEVVAAELLAKYG